MAALEMAFDGWAVLELLGHRRHVGRVQTVTLAGTPMIRVLALEWDAEAKAHKEREHFYAPSALYGFTPCTEDEAHAAVKPTVYDYSTRQLPYRDPEYAADDDPDLGEETDGEQF